MKYSKEIIETAKRVNAIFSEGCDRCEYKDLSALYDAGLMTVRTATQDDQFGHDSIEVGEDFFQFTQEGQELADGR